MIIRSKNIIEPLRGISYFFNTRGTMKKSCVFLAFFTLFICPSALYSDLNNPLPAFDSHPEPVIKCAPIDLEALARPVSLKLSNTTPLVTPQPLYREPDPKWLRLTGDSATHAASGDEASPLHIKPSLTNRNERLKKGRFYGIIRPRKRYTLFVGAFKYLWWRSQMTDGGLFCGSGIDF